MGAPKQKWTSDEEAALKAGVDKYGAGKWSTILKDPEFGPILHLRSNVDLKDKWRNLNVAANGFGSRHRVKVALKNTPKTLKGMAISTVIESDLEFVAATPLAVLGGTSKDSEPDSTKKLMPRLDNLILDAIAKLKEPRGSSRAAIATYIEEKYIAPPNLERLLAATLKLLTEKGKLIKVKHRYRSAPSTSAFVVKMDIRKSALEEKQKNSPKAENNGIKVPSKSQIDAELEKMKSMTAREAAAAAARAVAEAEVAIAEAEEAEREAVQAEAEAEAARLFHEAAESALKSRMVCT